MLHRKELMLSFLKQTACFLLMALCHVDIEQELHHGLILQHYFYRKSVSELIQR